MPIYQFLLYDIHKAITFLLFDTLIAFCDEKVYNVHINQHGGICMKKILALILATLMILPLVASCNQPAGPTDETTPDDTPGETTPIVTDKYEPEVPDEKYDYEVRCLSASNYWQNYDILGNTDDSPIVIDTTLHNAITKRNDKMEAEYGVTFKNITDSNVYSKAYVALSMNRDLYDIILTGITNAGLLAQKGYLIPAQELEYLDLSRPYYDQRCLEELDIGGNNFFFFSDITTVNLDAIWTFFFNHELIEYYSLENPYQLLSDYKWTLDKMIEMCSKATLDSDATPTVNDNWGMVGHDYIITSAYIGSGLRVATADDLGDISLTMNSNMTKVEGIMNKMIDLQKYWCRYALTSRSYPEYGTSDPYGFVPGDDFEELVSVFTSGNALFMAEVLSTLRKLEDYEMTVGLLPTPLYDESQTEYYSAVNHSGTATCIPTTTTDTGRISAIIEAWACESHYTLLPAYYEQCMQSRYAKDTVTPEALDMIFASRSYDLGIYYSWGNLMNRFTALTYNGQTDFSSMYEKNRETAQSALDTFVHYFGG